MKNKLLKRFLKYVDKTSSEKNCWLWTGLKNKKGYGSIWILDSMCLAHRVSYKLFIAEIPEKLNVLHKCDVTSCVNPEHLFLGSQNDNVQDMVSKGRANKATGDRNGSRRHREKRPSKEKHWTHVYPELVAKGDKNGSKLHPEKLKRGEQVNTAKLTDSDVIKIRQLYFKGINLQTLSAQFNVTATNIACIVKYKTWKHVKEQEDFVDLEEIS